MTGNLKVEMRVLEDGRARVFLRLGTELRLTIRQVDSRKNVEILIEEGGLIVVSEVGSDSRIIIGPAAYKTRDG